MRDAAGYVAYVKALIVANTEIVHSTTVREETQGDVGLFRYRLELQDGGLLEIFERFQIAGGSVQVTKYSFHWQDATGNLRKRWDNATHHAEVPTHPDHVHDGAEDNVLPHGPMSTEEVLEIVAAGRDQLR